MAFGISDIFKGIGNVTSGIGKFLYDAGIPDPMATAYGQKQEQAMKNQYYQLTQQKLAAELANAQKKQMLLDAQVPDSDIQNYTRQVYGYNEANPDAQANIDRYMEQKRISDLMKNNPLAEKDFAPSMSNTNSSGVLSAPSTQANTSGISNVFNVAGNGKNLNVSGGMNTDLMDDKYKDVVYNPPTKSRSQAMNDFMNITAQNYKADEIPYLISTPEQNRETAAIKQGRAMNANQSAEYNMNVVKSQLGVMKDTIDNINREVNDSSEYGRSVDEAQVFVNNTRKYLALVGLNPDMVDISISAQSGRKSVKLNNDIYIDNMKLLNDNTRTNNDTYRAGKYGENIDSEIDTRAKKLMADTTDPLKATKAVDLYGEYMQQIADQTSNQGRMTLYNNKREVIYDLGKMSGYSDEKIKNDLKHLNLIK